MSNFTRVKSIRIDGDFEGFDDEALFKLADGTYWIQDQYMYWYHYAYNPLVHILKSGNRYFLQVDGKDKIIPIRQIADVEECQIDGEFNGWEGETTYKLTNGQVWQQSEYTYEYTYSYMPEALIYDSGSGTRMKVEGTNVGVRRIK